MSVDDKNPLFDRELSWLSFNERVLQEAADGGVPLLERLRFLAIFSANLDEFFRVRVASLRSLSRFGGSKKKLAFNPKKVLKRIHHTVVDQQQEFGRIFTSEILPALRDQGIHLHDKGYLGLPSSDSLRDMFLTMVLPNLQPQVLSSAGDGPFLENRGLYLVVELWPKEDDNTFAAVESSYGIVEIPTTNSPRFLVLESTQDPHEVVFLDDVVRTYLDLIFPDHEVGVAYSIKMTRDAELYLDEHDFGEGLVDAIEKSLKKRATGLPTRLLFDPRAPYPMIAALKEALSLEEDDLVVGGVYHNFSDFFDFPDFGREDLLYDPQPAFQHPAFAGGEDMWKVISTKDRILHPPYQAFDPVVAMFEQAAADERVKEVYATLYRVAERSGIVEALIRAAENGKRVTVFVEVKARFDEAPNIGWARRMKGAGVRVLYSKPKIKVHAKLALVVFRGDKREMYAYLATGNFNESTARVYSDLGLFTADERLTREVRSVFKMLEDSTSVHPFEHLLVAPNGLRKGLSKLIKHEIACAREGRPAGITLKLNNLEDPSMIRLLYDASRAGVPVRVLVRAICRAVPGVPGVSENLVARSIVDRYLEHARIYRFVNGGDMRYYLASADWMGRNLDHRIEVAFPVYDESIKHFLDDFLEIQLEDCERSRIIDEAQTNRRPEDRNGVRSQLEMYRRFGAEAEQGAG